MREVLHHPLSQLLVEEHDNDYHYSILVLSTCFQIEDVMYTLPPLAWQPWAYGVALLSAMSRKS